MKNRAAIQFVVMIGIVNFFADFTYEGARGIVGPFLGSLGASAATLGFVAGLGELMGYALRSVSGYFADKFHRHWVFAFVGYAVNMLAVPALALAGQWPLAASLVVAERIGRGIRRPTVDAMLSYAGKSMGAGWVFGLNETLDQTGATVGPLLMALILHLNGGFRTGFAVLLIPALLCLATLLAARLLYPRPHELEQATEHTFVSPKLTRAYWIYFAAGALLAAGFADFALIGFHFQKADARAERLDSPVLRSGNGKRRARFDSAGPALRQIRCECFIIRVCYIDGSCAPYFSGHIYGRTDRDDFLGDRDERARFSISSDAYRHHSSTKTEHGLWFV